MTIKKYDQIYEVIRQVPAGKVATYGQIARIAGACTPRMVGYALAALKPGSEVPWQRIINSQGKISRRNDGDESIQQRHLLELEGVAFDYNGRVDFARFGWLVG
jgi:methylated-DNA-protein-cysteine methyltransferase-like protein